MKKRIIQRLLCLLLTLIGMVTAVLPALAAEPTERRTVRVGFFQFAGYHEHDVNGTMSGYGYECLQRLRLYNEWTFEYVGYEKSWSDMQTMLENGEIDLLTSAQKTPEREAKFDFSERAIGSSATLLTVKSGNTRYSAGDYAGYNGMRVGMIEGNSRNASFANFAEEKGFTYTPVYFESTTAMVNMLQTGGSIDAIVTSNLRSVTNEWVMDQFDTSEFYVMVKKGNRELLREVNYAIEQMDNDNPGWRTELFNKYYLPDTGDEIAFSTAERAYLRQIQEDGTVFRAAVNPDRKPYSYFENGEAKGIMVDAFKEIAAKLDLQYEIVPTEDREHYSSLLEHGGVDIWIDACRDYSLAESRGYELTTPYLTTTVSRITRHDSTLGSAQRIAALEYADLTRMYRSTLYPAGATKQYATLAECVAEVESGAADVMYAYTYSAQQIVGDDVRNRLTSTVMLEYSSKFAVAVSMKMDHRLAAIIDKSARSLKDDFIQQTMLYYTTEQEKGFSLIAFAYEQPFVMTLVAALVLALVFLVIFLRVRMRNAEKRRAQETQLARFMGYVCKANDMVLEVNLKDLTCKRYSVGADGQVEITNMPYRMHHGVNVDEDIFPEDFDELTANLSEGELEEMMDESGGEKYFECRAKSPQGVYEWYSFILQTIPKDAKHPRNFILFKKNIDEAKKEEEAKRQALSDALETARHASAAKGAFLSRMSHEIRTPLNAVIGYLSIAKMAGDDKEKISHCLDNGEVAAKHLLSIINDVLDMSSIESGRIKIAQESFDLKNLLTSISTIFYSQASAKKVNFTVSIRDLTNEWVVGDQLRVNQVMMNLLSNAVKFTPEGGTVSLTVTQMMADKSRVHIKFEVSDTGIGMSPEYMQRIFTPFEQESAKTAQRFGGTGLGLSITKNLVAMMDGSVDVRSEQNKGTTFTVSLPFATSAENDKLHETQHDFSKVRALIVDDQKNDSDYVKALLKRCGVKSDAVDSGDKAVRQIMNRLETDHPYDLCIMDWNMPKRNGVDTARAIREQCKTEMPIIIATAYDIAGIETEAKQAGVTKVISKPLFQSTLFNLLLATYGKYEPIAPAGLSTESLKGIRILLAEDNAMNLEIAVDILKKAGIVVETAEDGKVALDKFTASAPGTYQGILMDIQMPIMDGYEATRAIRASKHAEAATIPIIAMTANAFSEDVAEALACGMNDHISKPIDYAKLFHALEKFMVRKDNTDE